MANTNKAFTNAINGSLKKYVKPRPSYKKTKTLERVLELIVINKIVHLHGMSGSGKSQVVAGACQKLDEDPERIIWHVQCQTEMGALGREGKVFARKLKLAEIISREDETIVSRALNVGSQVEMKNFIDILNKHLSTPVLFVIEDIEDENEIKIVKTMIECMTMIDASVLKIQLLIATQKEEVFYPTIDLNSLEDYHSHHVKGFTVEEALEFLCDSGLRIFDKDKVEKLALELAYSPLALLMAKSHCEKYGVKYEVYYDSLAKNEDHRFEVIMKLLSPKDGVDKESKLVEFRVMQMMSFVNSDHIPTQMLKMFFQVSKAMGVEDQKKATSYLRKSLREVGAAEWDKDDDEKLITLHGDILRALYASMKLTEKREVLADVVVAFGTLLDKDNRMKRDYLLLHSLKEHAEEVARHCNRHFDQLVDGDSLHEKDYEILLGLSKIYEVIGFAISQHSGFREDNEEDKYYQRAMECLWAIVCADESKSCFRACLGKRRKGEDPRDLISYEYRKNAHATAQKVFDKMKKASKKEISEAMKNDWERLYPVKALHLGDMEKRLGKDCGIDWEKMKQEITRDGRLSKESRNQLEAEHMTVPWKKFNEFYLADRMSSILHSRGRQDNYKGDIIPAEMHEECRWYVEFGFQLCDIIFQKTGVKTIFHYILRANNQLPRLVRNREKESDEAFLQRIMESREKAHSLVREDADFHEQGIYKRISGTAWTVMNASKYLVKANTKVHKRPSVAKDFPNSEADKECEELYELCQNNKNIVISTTCLVHVGKYLAAREEYTKALEILESAFLWGIDQKLQANPTTYGWALSNMGRAILASRDQVKVEQKHMKRFQQRYDLLMANAPPEKWKKILLACRAEIDKFPGSK